MNTLCSIQLLTVKAKSLNNAVLCSTFESSYFTSPFMTLTHALDTRHPIASLTTNTVLYLQAEIITQRTIYSPSRLLRDNKKHLLRLFKHVWIFYVSDDLVFIQFCATIIKSQVCSERCPISAYTDDLVTCRVISSLLLISWTWLN